MPKIGIRIIILGTKFTWVGGRDSCKCTRGLEICNEGLGPLNIFLSSLYKNSLKAILV